MRIRALALLVLIASINPPAHCKQQSASARSQDSSSRSVTTHDGGVNEVMQSIYVPPKAGAPFYLTLETECDVSGRIYQELWALVPKNDPRVKSMMFLIQIHDPAAGTRYDCLMKTKTCELQDYDGSTARTYKPATLTSGPLPNNQGNAFHQDLGTQTIDGVATVGVKDVITYNAGVYGNDLPMTLEHEFWYSEQLGLNLLSVQNDPRVGKQTFTVTSVTRAEPDKTLFELPAGFAVIDRRSSARQTPASDTP